MENWLLQIPQNMEKTIIGFSNSTRSLVPQLLKVLVILLYRTLHIDILIAKIPNFRAIISNHLSPPVLSCLQRRYFKTLNH